MADLLFIVSRTERRQYLYLKHVFEEEGREVVLDRRTGERRQSPRPPPVERRHIERPEICRGGHPRGFAASGPVREGSDAG